MHTKRIHRSNWQKSPIIINKTSETTRLLQKCINQCFYCRLLLYSYIYIEHPISRTQRNVEIVRINECSNVRIIGSCTNTFFLAQGRYIYIYIQSGHRSWFSSDIHTGWPQVLIFFRYTYRVATGLDFLPIYIQGGHRSWFSFDIHTGWPQVLIFFRYTYRVATGLDFLPIYIQGGHRSWFSSDIHTTWPQVLIFLIFLIFSWFFCKRGVLILISWFFLDSFVLFCAFLCFFVLFCSFLVEVLIFCNILPIYNIQNVSVFFHH